MDYRILALEYKRSISYVQVRVKKYSDIGIISIVQ